MAQYRLNAYDADVYIPEFRGLMQYGDQMGTDLRYSPDCMNVETPGGVLQPFPKLQNVKLMFSDSEIAASANLQMMYLRATNFSSMPFSGGVSFYRGNHPSPYTVTFQINAGAECDELVFVVGTKLYYGFLPPESLMKSQGIEYGKITAIKVYQISGTYTDTKWTYCTYEHDFGEATLPGEPFGRTNVLIISNPTDGVYRLVGAYITSISSYAPSKFSCITRYAERVWGCGTGEDHDTLYYSRPYNVANWDIAGEGEQPEDGGGMIREATFDNDKLVALVPFGDSLIAFSELRAWRITGTDPSNFYIQEQYGNGTRCPKSIAVLNDRIIMLGNHGLVSYDGSSVTPFYKDATYEFFRDVQTGTAVANVIDGKYVLALSDKLSISSSKLVDSGFKFIVYNSLDGSITVADAPAVTSITMVPPFAWATVIRPDGDNAAKCDMVLLQFDSFNVKSVTEKATKWVSPWIDLGRKDIQKGGFEMYFTPELNTDDVSASVTLKFSIESEKKKKTKQYVVHSLTTAERTAGKRYKNKRLHFGGTGRRFRLIIETEAGNTVPWRLIGGIHIIAETDVD